MMMHTRPTGLCFASLFSFTRLFSFTCRLWFFCRSCFSCASPQALRWLLSLIIAVALSDAAAQPIHRCESGSTVSYADRPCPGATALITDEPPPETRKTGSQDASQQRQTAELARLQQLRELRERQDQRIRDLAARGAAAREKKCRALAMQRKWREEDVREASLKQEANARKRLRRTEERYQDECR